MSKVRIALGVVLGAGSVVLAAVPAFAATDYTNMFSGAQTEALAAVTAIVPLALAVFAVILGIRVGQRLFKQFTR